MAVTWDLLIAHIPHRHAELIRLLDVLEPQIQPGVNVIVYPDNLEADYATKCNRLVEASTADYVSHLSNDDSVSPDFIPRIMAAFKTRPDYVGFRCRYTIDGVIAAPIVHSLQYDGWAGYAPDLIYRDIVHFNPIRRDLANLVKFNGHLYADREWADALRQLQVVNTEVFIDDEMHYYQWSPGDQFQTPRAPMAPEDIPSLPERPFVRYIDPVTVEA
jgi:hypothetical protein